MTNNPPILEFDHVTKVFDTGALSVLALNDISLSVANREVVQIMGPSGSGKTTFLTIAGALMRPTSGRVLISGIDVTALNERALPHVRREKIGFVFQNFQLLDALSALQNVELVMSTRGLTGRPARERARELLAVVGIEDRQNNLPKQLSGGQKQRVAIARALANSPDLLLADEPTANLDSKRGFEIMQLLRMVAKELSKTVVAVTHDLRIRELADRVLWLEDGEFRDVGEEHWGHSIDGGKSAAPSTQPLTPAPAAD
jgi:putative ABC transport system ATP-binding protein